MSVFQLEENIVDRLLGSFCELERAIYNAKTTLSRNDSVPVGVIERLESYDTIIARQRQLAMELSEVVGRGDVETVVRLISIINGLSGMIIDDARSILSSFKGEDDVGDVNEEEAINYC